MSYYYQSSRRDNRDRHRSRSRSRSRSRDRYDSRGERSHRSSGHDHQPTVRPLTPETRRQYSTDPRTGQRVLSYQVATQGYVDTSTGHIEYRQMQYYPQRNPNEMYAITGNSANYWPTTQTTIPVDPAAPEIHSSSRSSHHDREDEATTSHNPYSSSHASSHYTSQHRSSRADDDAREYSRSTRAPQTDYYYGQTQPSYESYSTSRPASPDPYSTRSTFHSSRDNTYSRSYTRARSYYDEDDSDSDRGY